MKVFNTLSRQKEEVRIGSEKFLVLADCPHTQSEVTLVCKSPLNSSGSAQTSNAVAVCAFSDTQYWGAVDGDANVIPAPVGSAPYKCRKYAERLGGRGRLPEFGELGGEFKGPTGIKYAGESKYFYTSKLYKSGNVMSDGVDGLYGNAPFREADFAWVLCVVLR